MQLLVEGKTTRPTWFRQDNADEEPVTVAINEDEAWEIWGEKFGHLDTNPEGSQDDDDDF